MSANDILQELSDGYLHSFPNHLEEMENQILNLEKGIDFNESYNGLYRKVHSLKGSGGTYGFAIISTICHQLEDFLTDEISESANISQKKINVIFAYIDLLKEAHDLLLEKSSNFSSIEQTLRELITKDSQSTLRVVIVGSLKNMYGQICAEVLKENNVFYTACDTITAIERLQHEHFDVMITSQENKILNGTSLIAAFKLNNKNRGMKYILLTSNSTFDVPETLAPDYIIEKKADFPNKLQQTIEKLISEA